MLLFELDCCRRDSCIQLFGNISIHSLARRLTPSPQSWLSSRVSFQFTASQGGWRQVHNHHWYNVLFQFTASQGGWPDRQRKTGSAATFQFTASQGGWRWWQYANQYGRSISIHSLARRLTKWCIRQWWWPFHFNSQPRKEADTLYQSVMVW